ncbi:MAG: S8 family serine peptidase [Methanothrix sp.]|nr:S8 family serine peptidase [Methanothrix sp.]
MNLIILILAFISITPGVNAIEVGLTQDYGQSQGSYVYNNVLCSPPPGCVDGYYCAALDNSYPCDTIIYSDQPLPQSEPAECPDLPAPMVVVPRLGSGTFKPPEPDYLIHTLQWGEVPANQILVVTKKGCSHCIVQELAKRLNGEVVGYIDFINLYQIETPGKNEEDLRDDLSQAMGDPNILSAFPHQEIFPEKSPLEDPVYSKGRDRSHQIVGVQQSWDAIRSSGLVLSKAKIGVVDDGLYKGYGEFDGVVRINTKSNGSLLQRPSSEYPIAGSHGTGIMNILAADPDNGGLVGIASEPLRNNLSVTMINMRSPIYSKSGDAWFMGYMLALCQAGIGSDLLSFSWGNSEADPDAVKESEEFFKEWANTYPDHIFVCSAGNDGKAMDGSRRFPYTYHLPNVITVGCINNNGTLRESSNRISDTFEVTLAVPGDQVVWGKDDKGRIEDSGGETSMSVPFVTATVALVRSLDPSLNASSIKSLLVETARKSIDVGGSQVPAPKEVGGGILAIDLAVQKVIANLRNSMGVAA